MRASRLLSLLILLQVRGRASATDLAREFEVSVRTIYRDVDELSAAGVPVYAERGRGGGFALLDGFETRLTGLTTTEAGAFPFLGAPKAATELGLGAPMASAQRKVLASLPAGTGEGAARVAARFHLDPSPWYSRRTPPPHLRALADALWSDRRVRITYESWKGVVERLVDPLGLVLKAGEWYLVGAVDGAPRTYRVAAVQALQARDEPARRPKSFDLAAHWEEAARRFEDGLRGTKIRVRLAPGGLRLLRDLLPAAAEAASSQAPASDVAFEAVVPFEAGSHAVRDVLRMGGLMEVLEPRALRRAVAEEAARIAKAHARRR